LVCSKEVIFEIGDKVWLSSWHFCMTRASKKLDYKWTGLYTVSKVINKTAYKLDLPCMIRKHKVFPVSSLDCYTPPAAGHPPSELQPMVVDGSDKCEVDRILDAKRR
jgi:hypothetical protein